MNALYKIANEIMCLSMNVQDLQLEVDLDYVSDHTSDEQVYSVYPVTASMPLGRTFFNVIVSDRDLEEGQLNNIKEPHALVVTAPVDVEDRIKASVYDAINNAVLHGSLTGEPRLRVVDNVKIISSNETVIDGLDVDVCRFEVNYLAQNKSDEINVLVIDEEDIFRVTLRADRLCDLGDLHMVICAPGKLRGNNYDDYITDKVTEVIDKSPELPYVAAEEALYTPKDGVYSIPKIDNVLINLTEHPIEVDGYKVISADTDVSSGSITMGYIIDFTNIARGIYQAHRAFCMRSSDIAQMFFATKRNNDGIVVLEALPYDDVVALAAGYEYVNKSRNSNSCFERNREESRFERNHGRWPQRSCHY